MKRALFFLIITAILLVPCGVAYAYDEANTTSGSMTIEPADPALAPRINVFGNAIGGVETGDLFQIDASSTNVDTLFTLYITNVDELVHSYRYMNLNIGIYVKTDSDGWEKITPIAEGPDIYITMQNGLVNFTLPGNAIYKVTIEKGCFHSYCITPGKSVAIPNFYLTTS